MIRIENESYASSPSCFMICTAQWTVFLYLRASRLYTQSNGIIIGINVVWTSYRIVGEWFTDDKQNTNNMLLIVINISPIMMLRDNENFILSIVLLITPTHYKKTCKTYTSNIYGNMRLCGKYRSKSNAWKQRLATPTCQASSALDRSSSCNIQQ